MKLVRTSLYLTEVQMEWLRRNQEERKVPMAAAVREAVQDYMEKNPFPEKEAADATED
jgi:hypothetical protein